MTHIFLPLGSVGSSPPSLRWLGLGFGKREQLGQLVGLPVSPIPKVYATSARSGCETHVSRTPLAYAEKDEVEKSEAAHRFNCAQRKLLRLQILLSRSSRASVLRCPLKYPRECAVHHHSVSFLAWNGNPFRAYFLFIFTLQGLDMGPEATDLFGHCY